MDPSSVADSLHGLVASGRIVDLILVLVALEIVVMALLPRRPTLSPVDVLVTSLAGVGLLLALRAALTGAPWSWTALWLGAVTLLAAAIV